jgi:type II restriction enzyme
MNLSINPDAGLSLKSGAQRARVLTEAWALHNLACPSCGGTLSQYPNNSPVADFACRECVEDYELKSNRGNLGAKVPDGAYATMIQRLKAQSNPNLLLLRYCPLEWTVRDLIAIPKFFFIPGLIEKRPPLRASARRAGWVGCNILIGNIPASGRIPIVSRQQVSSREAVTAAWKRTTFLREVSAVGVKSWLLATMGCIDRLGRGQFDLSELYPFESELQQRYPNNRNIKAKIRQQLQVLRDYGYLIFLGKGTYRLTHQDTVQA